MRIHYLGMEVVDIKLGLPEFLKDFSI